MPIIHDSSNVTTIFASPSARDQATCSFTLFNISEQTISSSTLPSISDQTANYLQQTSVNLISNVRHVYSFEMQQYPRVVSADEHTDYTHDSDADYIHIIDDNVNAVNNEPSYNEPRDAESYREHNMQQQDYRSLVDGDATYQEIAGDTTSSNAQVDEQSAYNELNQAPTTSTSEASFNTDKPQ